jgi:hypothetical protein
MAGAGEESTALPSKVIKEGDISKVSYCRKAKVNRNRGRVIYRDCLALAVQFLGFIVESLGGNTSAGADFLREAVRRMDISGGQEGEDEGKPDEVGADDGSTGGAGAEGLDGDLDGNANTKRVAETDLEDLPRAKAARTVTGEGEDISSIFVNDAIDDNKLTIVILVRPCFIDSVTTAGGRQCE